MQELLSVSDYCGSDVMLKGIVNYIKTQGGVEWSRCFV